MSLVRGELLQNVWYLREEPHKACTYPWRYDMATGHPLASRSRDRGTGQRGFGHLTFLLLLFYSNLVKVFIIATQKCKWAFDFKAKTALCCLSINDCCTATLTWVLWRSPRVNKTSAPMSTTPNKDLERVRANVHNQFQYWTAVWLHYRFKKWVNRSSNVQFPFWKGGYYLALLPWSQALMVNYNYQKTLASNMAHCCIANTVTTCLMSRQASTEPWHGSKLCNMNTGKGAKHLFWGVLF